MAKAIVTGGAVRVGKAISLALAQEGYDIILLFNNSIDNARKVAKEIESLNKKCFLYKCDLSSKENIDSIFADISKKFDDIELLVNNASIFQKYDFMSTTESIFDSHFNTNLKAPFFLSQNFVYYVNARQYITSACIINMLDEKVSGVFTEHFAYHLTKKSLDDLTKMLAKDLAPKIRVNSISLGKVLPSKKDRHDIDDLGSYPKIKEITDVVLGFLRSKTTTGTNITIESDKNLL